MFIDQLNAGDYPHVYVTDFQSWDRSAQRNRDIKGNVAKKAKRKQAYFLAVEWTFVYGNGFGPLPATGSITADPLSRSAAVDTVRYSSVFRQKKLLRHVPSEDSFKMNRIIWDFYERRAVTMLLHRWDRLQVFEVLEC